MKANNFRQEIVKYVTMMTMVLMVLKMMLVMTMMATMTRSQLRLPHREVSQAHGIPAPPTPTNAESSQIATKTLLHDTVVQIPPATNVEALHKYWRI